MWIRLTGVAALLALACACSADSKASGDAGTYYAGLDTGMTTPATQTTGSTPTTIPPAWVDLTGQISVLAGEIDPYTSTISVVMSLWPAALSFSW